MPHITTKKTKKNTTKNTKSGDRWSTGHKGGNRVTLFTPARTGMLALEWFEGEASQWKRRSRSLGHQDWARGKREAGDLAEQLRQGTGIRTGGIVTLGALFDMYEREVTPDKGTSSQSHERRTFKLMLKHFGRETDVLSLDRRKWDGFIKARRSGKLSPGNHGLKVRNRIISQDLSLLQTVFTWATQTQDVDGDYLLRYNPWAGFKKPTEQSKHQPMFAAGQADALIALARDGDPELALALELCDGTGHRINSVRQLMWQDIDFMAGTITWRDVSDKLKRKHVTPLPADTARALRQELQRQVDGGRKEADILSGFIFPGSTPGRAMRRELFYKAWTTLKQAFPQQLPARAGFHSLRRKLASDLALAPGAIVAALGGWKNPHVAVQDYQRPSLDQQREGMKQWLNRI